MSDFGQTAGQTDQKLSASISRPGPELWLVRHGETPWSLAMKHTGATDVDLTALGERQASVLGPMLAGVSFDMVLSSPRTRARRTAALAGFGDPIIEEGLAEWDYGDFEGLTSPQIWEDYPGWEIWSGPWPGGESAEGMTKRVDGVLAKLRSADPGSRVLIFAHGHVLRALTARWLGEPVSSGRLFKLDTATLSLLSWEKHRPVVKRWNMPVAGPEDETLDSPSGR